MTTQFPSLKTICISHFLPEKLHAYKTKQQDSRATRHPSKYALGCSALVNELSKKIRAQVGTRVLIIMIVKAWTGKNQQQQQEKPVTDVPLVNLLSLRSTISIMEVEPKTFFFCQLTWHYTLSWHLEGTGRPTEEEKASSRLWCARPTPAAFSAGGNQQLQVAGSTWYLLGGGFPAFSTLYPTLFCSSSCYILSRFHAILCLGRPLANLFLPVKRV